MDIDIAALSVLANTTISLLSPYLKMLSEGLITKIGEEIGKATGESAWSKTKQLYEKVKTRFSQKPSAKEAIEDLEKSPEEPDTQAVARIQLKKILAEDEIFVKEITQILKELSETDKDVVFTAKIIGDSQNLLQIANSSLTSGRDIIGRDKVEIHHQIVNIDNGNQNDKAWINSRLKWVKTKRDLSMIEKISSTLDEISLYKQGRSLFENRDYFESVVFWEELYKRNPENTEYESYLRLSLSKVARDEDVENAYKSLMGKISSALALGIPCEAVRYLEQALVLSPSENETEMVIRTLNEARQKCQSQKKLSIETRINHANSAISRGDFQYAEETLKSALEIDPDSPEVLQSLVQLQNRKNEAKSGLTQRALDAGDSVRFTSIFLASSFFCSQAESTPAPAPVTQTVGWLVDKETSESL